MQPADRDRLGRCKRHATAEEKRAAAEFDAALGNHDDPNQRQYKGFNMNGRRFYSFKPKDGVRFFALDSNYMDKEQLDWLEKELRACHKTTGSIEG